MSGSPEIGCEDLLKALTARRQRVVSALKEMALDDDLDTAAQERLTGLVLRYDAAFRMFRQVREAQRRLRLDAKRGPAQRRMLLRKLVAAIAAVEGALEYAADDRKTEIFTRELQAFAVPRLVAAKKALQDIAEWHEMIVPAGGLDLKDPRAEATADLVTFFENDCGWSKFDAETRTAEIFTALRWRRASHGTGDEDVEIVRETAAVRKRRSRARSRK